MMGSHQSTEAFAKYNYVYTSGAFGWPLHDSCINCYNARGVFGGGRGSGEGGKGAVIVYDATYARARAHKVCN